MQTKKVVLGKKIFLEKDVLTLWLFLLMETIHSESDHSNSSHFQNAYGCINRSYLLPGSHPPMSSQWSMCQIISGSLSSGPIFLHMVWKKTRRMDKNGKRCAFIIMVVVGKIQIRSCQSFVLDIFQSSLKSSSLLPSSSS